MINLKVDKDLAYSVPALIESNQKILKDLNSLARKFKDQDFKPFKDIQERTKEKLSHLKITSNFINSRSKHGAIISSSCRTYSKSTSLPLDLVNETYGNPGSSSRNRSSAHQLSIDTDIFGRRYHRDFSKFSLLEDIQLGHSGCVKNLIFVEFYPDQFAAIVVQPGCTICQVLFNQMNNRNLKVEECDIINYKDGEIISWNRDSQLVSMTMIVVIPKSKRNLYQPTLKNHEMRTKIVARFCKICHKFVHRGLSCDVCNESYHKKCFKRTYNDSCCFGKKGENRSLREVQNEIIEALKFFRSQTSVDECSDREVRELSPAKININTPVDEPIIDCEEFSVTSIDEILEFIRKFENTSKRIEITFFSSMSERKSKQGIKEDPGKSDSDWLINGNEVNFGKVIGSGSFGTVYKGQYHGNVAIKVLKMIKPTQEQLESFKNEAMLLRKCRHKNIILFMGCIYEPHFGIITAWCDGDTLYKHLHVQETMFEPKQICDFARQIAEGMNYLHNQGIVHRDIKSNNIFLVQKEIIKIGDLGLATLVTTANSQKTSSSSAIAGSILWMAPEVIRSKTTDNYSTKSDVYSYGIVLYEMLSGSLPYSDIKNLQIIFYRVGQNKLSPDLTKINQKSPISKLVNRCLLSDPELRPTFDEIVKTIIHIHACTPFISRTTSHLHSKSQEQLNLSPTYLTMMNNLYREPLFLKNLKSAYSNASDMDV